ncbi:MAG: energy-coupling factor transporter transmembrane component T [Pirellulales bacterium]
MNGLTFGADLAKPWLAELDPRLKLAVVFGLSVAVVCVNHPAALAACCLAGTLFATGLRLRSRGWWAIVLLLALVVWSTMLSQGFFYGFEPRTILLTVVAPSGEGAERFPGIALSLEGLEYGAVQSLRLVATMLAGLAASLSTGPQRMLVALGALRVPPAVAFMTATALRFLPLLVEELALARQARRYRGYRFRIVALHQELGILLPVIAASIRRAETLAESVTARGFDPRRPRTNYPPLRMRRWERQATLAIVLGCVGLVIYRTWRDWPSV